MGHILEGFRMKNILILLLVLLALLVGFFSISDDSEKKTSVKIDDREFILKDPSKAKTITIDTRGRPMVHLSENKNGWYINNKHRANQRIVTNMLNTLNRMTIQYIPTKAEGETAKKRMEMHGIDVKVYDDAGEAIIEFTMGTNTNTEYGTYCLKKDSDQVYVMSNPIIEGGIRNFFTQSQEQLRDLTVFAFEPNNIRKISVDYPKDVKNSFSIIRNGTSYELSSPSSMGDKVPSQNILDAYVKDFTDLQSEIVKNDHVFKDTILTFIPFLELTIETVENSPLKCQVYPKNDMVNSRINTRSVDDLTPQHEGYFLSTNRGDFYLVQGRLLNKFLKKVSYFYEKPSD